jgi:hypothetical protein
MKHLYISNREHLMCGKPAARRSASSHLAVVTCTECIEAHRVAKSLAVNAVRRVFRDMCKAGTTTESVTISGLDGRDAFLESVRLEMDRP